MIKRLIIGILVLSAIYGAALATQDNTPPVLTGFTLSVTDINTTAASQTVTATFTVTDVLVGFDQGAIALYGPTSSQLRLVTFNSTNRVSGTANNGTYSIPLVWPQYSNVGTWWVSTIWLSDLLGNTVCYPRLQVSSGTSSNPVFGAYSAVHAH